MISLSNTSILPRVCVIALTMLFVVEANYAQNKNRKKDKGKQASVVLSEEKQTELEHYFMEGEKCFILKDFSKSITYFERVLEIDPYNATASYKIAQIYNDKGEAIKALPFAKDAKNLAPDNKFYYLLLANVQTSLGELDQAEVTYQELVNKVPGTENYLFDLAALQIYQQKYPQAIKTYEQAQLLLGPMEEISLQKQHVYLKENQLDQAIKEGYELMRLNPDEKSYVMTQARIMISNERLEEAEKFLEEQIKLDPKNDELAIMLSEVYRKDGEVVKALKTLQIPFESTTVDVTAKIRTLAGYLGMLPNEELNEPLLALAVTLVKTHPDSYQALAMTGDLYYNLGKLEDARKYYLMTIKVDGSNFGVWQNILNLDMDLQDYAAVISHTNQALEMFPNQASLYYYNGTAHLINKDYEGAIKAFNAGKAYASRDANMNSLFYGQLGDAYNSIGDHSKSDEAYELALKSKPDNDHVLNNYSYFLSLRKKDLEKAKSMSSKLVKDYPQNPTYLDTHAWVLYMMEDYAGAVEYLKEAIKYDASAVIIEHYGDALFQLGKIEEAVIQWKKARDLNGDSTTLDKKIADRQLYE
ncbi:tetratricopeptide repeat protein [Reichenbachiella agarivorans]|uniref:Tetratricopeptide repeat protein n=1 Tax=Reichenbachiella agarivorans TaxID=2979464 RepID=A0ABY6CRQ5_9BACT|nr:tetratricopeptide repeat protein [Reichenbachiella agarivorans]UXP33181.1 tetratricopeptide repeat protein [Reichenbachiella agarivorans]